MYNIVWVFYSSAIYDIIVILTWIGDRMLVSESLVNVSLYAFADGWTTDDSTVRVPIQYLSDTAEGKCG